MAKERRTGLGLLDRLILFVAWVATCGLVYVLGLYVGKGMQERRLGLEERVVRLPVTSAPPPEGQHPKTDNDLTFYDTLVPGERGGRPAPATPSTTMPSTAARAVPPSAPIVVPAPARPTTAAPPSPPATHQVARPAAPAVTTAAVPTTLPAPPAAPGGGWSVQANPTRSRDEADTLARELHGKGYDAVVVRLPRDGDVWYRVRIGRYATSEQATEVMQRLRDREGVHAFVAGGE